MNPAVYIGLAVAIVAAGLFYFRYQSATPSASTFAEISDAIGELQAVALNHVYPESSGTFFSGVFQDQIECQTKLVAGTLRFIYTIEQHKAGYLHTVSSQRTARRPKKYQIASMLVVMLFFQRQLGEMNINPEDVEFGIEESELGTQYVHMKLTADQQSMLCEHTGHNKPPGVDVS